MKSSQGLSVKYTNVPVEIKESLKAALTIEDKPPEGGGTAAAGGLKPGNCKRVTPWRGAVGS